MAIISKEGDTVLQQGYMFGKQPKGQDVTILTLHGHVVLARPIYSGKSYTIHHKVTDALGGASFTTEMDFEVVPDPLVNVRTNGLSFSEAYIFSADKDKVITDGEFSFYENIRLIFQDLNGYVKKEGAVHLGMSVKVEDADGNMLLDNPDVLFQPIINEDLLKQGVSSMLKMNEGVVSNPLKWYVNVWDKNSDAQLSAKVEISVKE